MIAMLLMASAAWGLAGHRPQCLAAERASGGVIFCSPKNVSFVLAGRTTGNKYSIYNYHYRIPRPGLATHGGQRLIIFRGDIYVGQYVLLPEVTVAVSGTHVVLKGDEDVKAVRLDFSRGHHSRIHVNGEVETLFR